ncbi:MAG: hypothetical protein NVSMB14_12700 [Isosphaeraceae bacterium]
MSKIRPIKPIEITADDWKRTRGAVLNVLILASFGIAACGIALGRRPIPAPSAATRQMGQQTYAGLIGIVLLGYAYRRMYGSASRLREIGGLARFRSARIASAWIATLAVPLGFAHGFYVRPTLDGVAPFWVATLALGALAVPKNADLAETSLSDSRSGGPST